MRRSFARPGPGVVVAALSVVAAIVADGRARASDLPDEAGLLPRLFVRLAAGPAFNYESWSPDGGSPGASYTAWGPALDVAVGRRLRRGLVVAGDLQLAMLVNRTESYLGGSYPLTDTLHFIDTLGALVDETPWSKPWFHFGGALGVMAATDVDTHMGSTKTSWGWSLSAHAGLRRHLARAWWVGVMARLTFYRFGSDTLPPSSTSVGLLPVLLLTFTR